MDLGCMLGVSAGSEISKDSETEKEKTKKKKNYLSTFYLLLKTTTLFDG